MPSLIPDLEAAKGNGTVASLLQPPAPKMAMRKSIEMRNRLPVPDRHRLALEIVEICSWMYQKGFIASSEGNVSASLGADRILVTPRGAHKGLLQPEQLVVTDLAGRQVSGTLAPSSELPLHLLVYRKRPDVRGIIHAHPTMAIVCSLAGISLDDGVVPEVITSLGGIPIAPYATPGTDEAAEVIGPFIQQFDAIVLARHGSVTVGRDLREAYSKLEMLEHTAQNPRALPAARPSLAATQGRSGSSSDRWRP